MKRKFLKITALIVTTLFAGIVAWGANVLTKKNHEMWE
jgi:hypothetical protein